MIFANIYKPLALVALLGCGGVEEANEKVGGDIERDLAAYLPLLAEAYRTGDAGVLEGYAAEKEIAGLSKRLSDMLAESRELRPVFESFTVEETTVWSQANAYVTTLETWDLTVLASGTDRVLSETLGQRNRVKYQLKLVDQRWQVFFRELDATFE